MVIVLMGVTGSGKTTVGTMLADELGWEFHDADSFHPEANVKKMSAGQPLTDEDRLPWLQALSDLIQASHERNRNIVLACSALKHRYRKILRNGLTDVKFVYLRGTTDLIAERLSSRKNHFMNPNLLASQFATLEEPKDAIYMDITPQPEIIVSSIRKELGL